MVVYAGPVLSDAEERLVVLYRSKASCVEKARSLVKHRDETGITKQELARRMGVTAGALHHYESLIRQLRPELLPLVENGSLVFKEARAIADLPADRQRAVAEPFATGRLSSLYVETVVKLVKDAPGLPVAQVVAIVTSGSQRPAAPVPATLVPAVLLERRVVALAEEIRDLRPDRVADGCRSSLTWALEVLAERATTAARNLSKQPLGVPVLHAGGH